MIKSETAYVNKSTGSHRSQPPTAQRALSMDAAIGLPLQRPTRCLTSARLMSATSLKFIAPGITADATSLSEFDRYLAAPAAEACDAMQWWAVNAHHYRNTARLAKQYLSVPATSTLSGR